MRHLLSRIVGENGRGRGQCACGWVCDVPQHRLWVVWAAHADVCEFAEVGW